MKSRIIWRFLGAYIVLIILAVFILNFFVSAKLQDYYETKITDKLKTNSFLAADLLTGFPLASEERAKDLADKLNTRVTIIDKDGRVLGDSEKNWRSMEDHSNRPEIIEAIRLGYGESTRFSDTLGFNMKYVAAPIIIDDNLFGIVRLALPLSEIQSELRVIYRVVLLGGIISILIAFVIGYFISRGITRPITQMTDIAESISRGDFSKKASVKSKNELGILARSLNKMADELQSQLESLKKLNTVRTDFVANVSHELKTPLTSIKGFIETLEDGALDDKENAQKFIGIIKKHTERISSIIDDLLSLSELELGKDRLNRQSFDLKKLVDEILLGFGHALSAKRHSIETSYNGKDFNITADREKTEEVFVNLIDNAIKYTNSNGKILVNLSENEDDFLIEIKDNGIGIPKEHLDRIFERFYRVDKARSRQLGGTGLGLAIVKHIILLNNGAIDIDSELNKGTRISFSLPKA
ncbi:MAG: cell wall metabolism sensor histidine kinase WalK [Candidatus Omnitrophica bacterium]|nr:cell wall metabolism sensor histidine kinase WalK [Candidatus Omnitrophota bacterium]